MKKNDVKTNRDIDPRYYNGKPEIRYLVDYSSVFYLKSIDAKVHRKLGKFLKNIVDGSLYFLSPKFSENLLSFGIDGASWQLKDFQLKAKKNLTGMPFDFKYIDYFGTHGEFYVIQAGFNAGDKPATEEIVRLFAKSIPDLDIRAYMCTDGKDFLFRFVDGELLSKEFNVFETSED